MSGDAQCKSKRPSESSQAILSSGPGGHTLSNCHYTIRCISAARGDDVGNTSASGLTVAPIRTFLGNHAARCSSFSAALTKATLDLRRFTECSSKSKAECCDTKLDGDRGLLSFRGSQRFRKIKPSPRKPVPSNTSVPGSGAMAILPIRYLNSLLPVVPLLNSILKTPLPRLASRGSIKKVK